MPIERIHSITEAQLDLCAEEILEETELELRQRRVKQQKLEGLSLSSLETHLQRLVREHRMNLSTGDIVTPHVPTQHFYVRQTTASEKMGEVGVWLGF